MARTRFRDSDGVTRVVERRGPADGDQHGKLAEDALTDASALRRAPAGGGEITLDTKLTVLVDRHIERLIEDDRAAATIETYRATATKLAKIVGGLRMGSRHRLASMRRCGQCAPGTGPGWPAMCGYCCAAASS